MARRLGAAVPGLVGVVVVTFFLMRALPGDPAAYFAGNAASKEAIEQVRAKLGLDKSLPEQFAVYVRDLARGDLGQSVTTGQPVRAEMLARLPASLELTLSALLLAVAVAVPAGVLAATQPGSWVDQAVRVLTTAGVSLPTFFTGILLVYVFYYLLGWSPSPTGRLDSLFVMAPLARMTRASMLGVLGSDFIRTARASGLSRRTVLWTYGFRNAMLPVVTTLGMIFSFMLGANVLVEKVFAWPGIGSFAVEALIASDFAPVQGFVLTMAVMYVALNLLIDILYGLIDPRVRIEA